jgi:hypothetical protein
MTNDDYWGGDGFDTDLPLQNGGKAPKADKAPKARGIAGPSRRSASWPPGAGWHESYHRIIIGAGVAGAILAGVIAAAAVVSDWPPATNRPLGKTIRGLLFMPVLGGSALAAVACALAPRSFLEGPVGRRWLSWVGTSNVIGARVVCTLIAVIVIGVFSALAYFTYMDM